VLLVVDSLGMVVLGYSTTIPVTLDAMIHHTQAVVRGTERALIVTDLPFLSYQVSTAEALRNAGRLLQEGGAAAVKLEGGRAVMAVVERLVEVGIPVMGHLGLLPQSIHQLGGFRQQATRSEDAERLLEDAHGLEKAGAFAVVLESIPAELARKVTAELRIPTIGIGAGPDCDGQVLVLHDVMGLSTQRPPFAREFAPLGEMVVKAAAEYVREVREGTFPPRRNNPPA
ncbi:MAG: 3-methyl-2-oxobutanoate hydroxymethyltransferase, partial [Acidobacteria bacterium]|nr:3-methyl-2-oxobutanoate hydroxymethyltransferase [Acidobacteriota bacterium]